jgi:hypothetical protein
MDKLKFKMHGKYGGPGWTGGEWDGSTSVPPDDHLDHLFQKHDINYGLMSKSKADRLLADDLEKYLSSHSEGLSNHAKAWLAHKYFDLFGAPKGGYKSNEMSTKNNGNTNIKKNPNGKIVAYKLPNVGSKNLDRIVREAARDKFSSPKKNFAHSKRKSHKPKRMAKTKEQRGIPLVLPEKSRSAYSRVSFTKDGNGASVSCQHILTVAQVGTNLGLGVIWYTAPLNPTFLTPGSRASILLSQYAKYRFKSFTLHYEPAVSTTVNGSWMSTIVLDPSFNFTGLSGVNLINAFASNPDLSVSNCVLYRQESKQFKMGTNWCFVTDTGDDRFAYPGTIYLASSGSMATGTMFGFFWAEYEIELLDYIPRSYTPTISALWASNSSVTSGTSSCPHISYCDSTGTVLPTLANITSMALNNFYVKLNFAGYYTFNFISNTAMSSGALSLSTPSPGTTINVLYLTTTLCQCTVFTNGSVPSSPTGVLLLLSGTFPAACSAIMTVGYYGAVNPLNNGPPDESEMTNRTIVYNFLDPLTQKDNEIELEAESQCDLEKF